MSDQVKVIKQYQDNGKDKIKSGGMVDKIVLYFD
jgi:hypothetical protein